MTTPRTPAVPVGTTVLAAWDANRWIELDKPGALDEPYVRDRLGRWTVAEFSDLTGSYSLTLEGTDGPRFIAYSTACFVPEPGQNGQAPATWMARRVETGWHMQGTGVIETVTTHANGQVTFSGDAGHRSFPTLDTLVQATNPDSEAAR